MTYSKRFRKNSQERASTDFTQFPFTHDSIFKRILLYAGFEVAIQCQEVCPVWKLYFQRLNIWHQLLRNEVRRAQRFASKARCNSLLDEFIIHELERDVHISRLMLSETNLLSLIINFGKRLSQILELAQKIKMIPCDLELHHQQHVHDFMMRAENRLEKGRKHIRYINKRFAPKDKEFHEFLMTASNECGFSSETYFQAVRISEFVNLRRHPVNQRDKKFIAMLSIAVASSKTEKTGPSSSSLLEYFFEDALVAEQDCFRNLVDQSKEKLKYSWYHPSARMFLHNFLRMMKEEGSKDLVILANYFVHLLTGYTGTLSGFPAPSLIALGSMAAARQMLGLCYRHPETGGPVQSEEEVMEVRDKALALHGVVRDSVYQESPGDSSL